MTDLDQRPRDSGAADSAAAALLTGRIATAGSLVLCVLLQWVSHDFFPPQISVSQYGIGPRGWVFTLWTAVTALALMALYAGGPSHRRGVGYLLAVGSVGLLVMGVVRTDAGGLQHSWHAKVHMVSSILALVALPFGMAFALHWTRLWWRRLAWALTVVSSAALIMVLVSAFGVASPGLDAPHSWALWQAVAVTLDMILLAMFALGGFNSEPDRAVDRPATP